MATDLVGLLDALVSHQASLGVAERITRHEPKSAPGDGITIATTLDQGGPLASVSGLASTTGRIVVKTRFQQNFIAQPEDDIDPNIYRAVALLEAAYSADFTLGGLVKQVDLLGAHGIALSWRSGYAPQDGFLYRVVDLLVPLVINDMYAQAA